MNASSGERIHYYAACFFIDLFVVFVLFVVHLFFYLRNPKAKPCFSMFSGRDTIAFDVNP